MFVNLRNAGNLKHWPLVQRGDGGAAVVVRAGRCRRGGCHQVPRESERERARERERERARERVSERERERERWGTDHTRCSEMLHVAVLAPCEREREIV